MNKIPLDHLESKSKGKSKSKSKGKPEFNLYYGQMQIFKDVLKTMLSIHNLYLDILQLRENIINNNKNIMEGIQNIYLPKYYKSIFKF